MAYIFDPLRNTFIDDEDTSLGNKLALLDDDLEKAIREIGEKYGPDAIKTLDQLPENKPKEVEDTEAFNRFNRMYEDGGMVRKNFADNPLQNFQTVANPNQLGDRFVTSDLPFDLVKPVEPIAIGQKITPSSLSDLNPNEAKNYISETDLLKRLGYGGGEGPYKESFYRTKYQNKSIYNKLLNIVGEPVVGPKKRGSAFPELYYDKTNLNKESIKYIMDPKSRVDYDYIGKRGKLVIDDENLKNLFIEKYNEGYAPKHILKLIDPQNKLNVTQPQYGQAVAEELIKSNDLIPRTGISQAQKEYFNQNVKNTDLTIEKIGKIYDKNPSGSLERIAHVIAGGKKNFDGASPRQQTEFMNEAGLRSYDFLQYLKGARPSVDKNTNLKIKNKNEIINVLENSKHPIYGIIKEGDIRQFKFAEQDAFFGDKRNTHLYIRRDINNLVNLQAKNVKAKNRFVIDEGPGLTTALKNGLPVLTRFSNLFNKKTNQAKIELDLKLINAYPVVTNLDTGKTKYTITEIDVEKSKTHGYGLTEKDIGKVINKKDHPAIKAYNKFSRSFSKANKVKTPIFEFGNIEDKIDLKDRTKITDEAAKELKKMNKTYGFYMSNMGTDLKLIEQKLKDKPLKKSDFSKKAIVFKKMRDGLQDVYNTIPFKGARIAPSAAAAVLDYSFFTNVMGIPSAEAALGAANWFTKNKDAARKIGDAIIAVTEGSLTVDEFIKANGNLLTEIAKASVESTPISKDDNIMDDRLKEMDQAMAVPELDKTTAAPLYDFANGGRVNFNSGGAAGADDDFAAQLEYFFLNPDAELPAAQTFRETKNPISIINDMIDPRNIPYYADRLVESGIRIGEFGARVLPAVGKLAADLIQKPAFKIKPASGQGYVQDYTDIPPSNITGTGIFSEFLDNLVGSEGTKAITEKTGLAKLIKDEEQKMKDERKTAGAKILADQVTLGMELTAPIFPGLKLLKAYAKNRNLPVDKTTREIMDKEIDEVLTKRGISRRDFMKVAGAGATVAIAKLLGVGDDLATVTKVAEKAVPKGPIVPPYFFTLVDKIKKLGRDESKAFATMDREVVYVYKDYELYEDLSTGNIRITRKIGDETGYKEEEMVYTKGIGDESTQGTPPDEYDEFTVRSDPDGKMKNIDNGLEEIDDLIDEVGAENITIKDLEAMGYEIDRLPMAVQRKLGIQKPVSDIDRALKKSDDDLPDLPF